MSRLNLILPDTHGSRSLSSFTRERKDPAEGKSLDPARTSGKCWPKGGKVHGRQNHKQHRFLLSGPPESEASQVLETHMDLPMTLGGHEETQKTGTLPESRSSQACPDSPPPVHISLDTFFFFFLTTHSRISQLFLWLEL